ncbi:NAD(P)-dependent oxidoreductase [Mitsuaria sp. 7]|uniref:NAD-dependent epimerase/dehydratase family protein n=1 Tax=Mitsuaria sp. 7 TaxID=1658665 RepID=UPI0007DD0ADA|nr:NAD(P)-dependent oxidoreductase [Mitsuaria sp. 7]ANH67598.1 hypothetical protein ABE85_08520 [Mitsuaria sp. 7]
MRIVLTGPTGFLGSALARRWAADGHELLLLARPGSRTQRIDALLGESSTLSSSASSASSPSTTVRRIRLVRADGMEAAAQALRDFAPDAVVHTACAYGRAGETPLDVLDANLRLGTALLQAAAAVQGRSPVSFLNTGTVLSPEVSLYALSKTQFSAWGATLAGQQPERLRFIDLRLQQMYGAGDDRSKFTTHVIESCRRNEPRLALTAGEQRRDFIHIDDVVDAYDRVLAARDGFAAADAIEVGSGDAVRMRDFVELTRRLTGAATQLDFGAVPYRAHEAMLCVADTARLRGLGWVPRFDLEAGLRQTLAASSSPDTP